MYFEHTIPIAVTKTFRTTSKWFILIYLAKLFGHEKSAYKVAKEGLNDEIANKICFMLAEEMGD